VDFVRFAMRREQAFFGAASGIASAAGVRPLSPPAWGAV
jgi:hypothetical protein